MALLLADGFDLYANVADVVKSNWSSLNAAPGFSTSLGKYGGGCLTNSNQANSWHTSLGSIANSGSVYIAFWYYCAARASGGATDAIVRGSFLSGAIAFSVIHDTTGVVKVNNRLGAQIGSSSGAGTISNAAWHWVEILVSVGTSTANSTITLQINGATLVNSAAADIWLNANFDGRLETIEFAGSTGGARFDDVIIWDNSGSSFNSWPLGEMQIDTFIPNGDGTNTDWTRSTGATNYTLVDDGIGGTSNDDTDYLSSSTAGNKTDILMSNFAVLPASIKAVQIRARAKKTDAGVRTWRANAKVGVSVTNGPTVGQSTDYSWKRMGVFYVSPDTGVAWTAAKVNQMQVQLELVA